MVTHKLKIDPKYFRNDRNFHIGDKLLLCEYDRDKNEYTGNQLTATITYVTGFAQNDGYMGMGYMKYEYNQEIVDAFQITKANFLNSFEKWITSMIPDNYNCKIDDTAFGKVINISKWEKLEESKVMDLFYYSDYDGEGSNISGTIYTEEEEIKVSEGDYIVKDADCNFYSYKPSDFTKIYEPIKQYTINLFGVFISFPELAYPEMQKFVLKNLKTKIYECHISTPDSIVEGKTYGVRLGGLSIYGLIDNEAVCKKYGGELVEFEIGKKIKTKMALLRKALSRLRRTENNGK